MSASGAVEGIDQFTDSVKEVLDAAWDPGWGEFTSEWPTGNDPNVIPLPAITYELFHRVPSKSMKTIKPRNMGYVPDPDVPGGIIWHWSMWFDCLVDFGIWAKTNREAEDLKRRFEDMMMIYAGQFKKQGVSEILFISEMKPTVSTKWRQDIPHRALRYFVRIERIIPVRSDTLQKISAEITVDGNPGVLEVDVPSDEASQFLKLYNSSAKPDSSSN